MTIRTATLVAIATATLAPAQGLDPAAPPADTPGIEARTPISSLPFTIAESGSYFLTGNLTGGTDEDGITVQAAAVTIDLNGFTLTGDPGVGLPSDTAIVVDGLPAEIDSLTVRNGTIRFWGEDGIDFPQIDSCRVEGVRIEECSGTGIQLGDNALVTDCQTQNTGGSAIRVGQHSVVTDCVVFNTGSNFSGIQISEGSTVQRCTVRGAGGDGIGCSLSSHLIFDCVVTDCGGAGIDAGPSDLIERCVLDGNAIGADLTLGGRLANCVVRGNTDSGVVGQGRCAIVDSTFDNNGDSSQEAGILLADDTGLSGNCRVEGNHIMGSPTAIRVESDDNVIVRNTYSDNSAGIIIAGDDNDFGPILSLANGLNDPIDTDNPWSNIAH